MEVPDLILCTQIMFHGLLKTSISSK
jgi:hypothetical protein